MTEHIHEHETVRLLKPEHGVGIVGYGAYVPRYRLPAKEVARVWTDGTGGLPIVEKSVPGLDEDDLEVHVSGRQLTIHGSRTDEWDDSRHGLRRRERVSGSFTRTITQPPYADTQNIEARYEKGTLHITVPKLPGHAPRRVKVTVA